MRTLQRKDQSVTISTSALPAAGAPPAAGAAAPPDGTDASFFEPVERREAVSMTGRPRNGSLNKPTAKSLAELTFSDHLIDVLSLELFDHFAGLLGVQIDTDRAKHLLDVIG